MGLGKDEALRIRQQEETSRRAQEWKIEKGKILDREAPEFWNALVAKVQKEITDFKTDLTIAQRLEVRLSDGNNKLVIQTNSPPFVTQEVIFRLDMLTVTSHAALQLEGGGTHDLEAQKFRIDVGPSTGVTFINRLDNPVSVEAVADILLGPVFRTFG
jgi:hypothetical protein